MFRCERRGNGGGKGLGSKDVWDQLLFKIYIRLWKIMLT